MKIFALTRILFIMLGTAYSGCGEEAPANTVAVQPAENTIEEQGVLQVPEELNILQVLEEKGIQIDKGPEALLQFGGIQTYGDVNYSGVWRFALEQLIVAYAEWTPNDSNTFSSVFGDRYLTHIRLAGTVEGVSAGTLTVVNGNVRSHAPFVAWNDAQLTIPGCTINPAHRYGFFLIATTTSSVVMGRIVDRVTGTVCTKQLLRPGRATFVPNFDTAMFVVTRDGSAGLGKFAPFSMFFCQAQGVSQAVYQPENNDSTSVALNLVDPAFTHTLSLGSLVNTGTVRNTWTARN